MFDTIFADEFLLRLDPTTTQEELDFLHEFIPALKVLLLVSAIITSIFFLINIIVLRGLYKERYNQATAHKVYTYQFIYGIVMLFLNTVVGIMYVISGNQGMNNQPDTIEVREGI
jgi:uncharacterized protein YhhL (DUF1145 family)